jgi:hypothetical protein
LYPARSRHSEFDALTSHRIMAGKVAKAVLPWRYPAQHRMEAEMPWLPHKPAQVPLEGLSAQRLCLPTQRHHEGEQWLLCLWQPPAGLLGGERMALLLCFFETDSSPGWP